MEEGSSENRVIGAEPRDGECKLVDNALKGKRLYAVAKFVQDKVCIPEPSGREQKHHNAIVSSQQKERGGLDSVEGGGERGGIGGVAAYDECQGRVKVL